MSGPKTSRYTLTLEQKRILAEQRELERRKSVASERIKRSREQLRQIAEMFSAEKQVSLETKKYTGNDGGFSEVTDRIDTIISNVNAIVEKTNYDDMRSLEEAAKTVTGSLETAKVLSETLSQISVRNERALQTALQADIDKGFHSSFDDAVPSHHDTTSEIKAAIREPLLQMKNNPHLPSDLAKTLDGTIARIDSIDNEEYLKNFSSVTVVPLLRQCKDYLDEYDACHSEFESLYAEYSALCDLYYFVAQPYSCCAESLEILRSEIGRITELAAVEDEQSYICNCVDEVMEDMGYQVIGNREVTKKNGKHFRNELFTYGEGTAVNVTYSPGGRIAMELGGLDKTDRLPNDYEAAALCKSMEQFCDDFKEIEVRLLAKGVLPADRISLLPPNVEYAQIINTADYDMIKETDRLQTKRIQKALPKHRATRNE